MKEVLHKGEAHSFKLCILRGDGWGCVVFYDNIVRQIKYLAQLDVWQTTGVIEELKNFIPEEPPEPNVSPFDEESFWPRR